MPKKIDYILLTFYHFCDISDLQTELKEHRQFLEDIGVKWRIYIWTEWISSTVTGRAGQVSAYQLYLKSKPYFADIADIDVKATAVEWHSFDKLIIRIREEIVSVWKVVTPEQVRNSYKKIPVEKVKEIIDTNDPEYVFLDMRNSYEYKVWHFKWAIDAGTVNFKEMQEMIKDYPEKFKGKKVIMYCTWGVRCEKLSVLCDEVGMDNMYAVDGWVVKYVNTYNDWNWLGNLYTFDGRVSTFVWDENSHTTIGECIFSWEKTDNCVNCRHSPCNARIIADPKHYRRHLWFCSQECFDGAQQDLFVKPINRDPFDYKQLRTDIKKNPELESGVKETVTIWYRKNIREPYNHKTSQKEDIVDRD
jgi:UPF0176 protein